jgi:hypothetical protein
MPMPELKQGSFDNAGMFVAGAAVLGIGTAVGSVAGPLGAAIGSAVGGWAGAKIAKGNFEKGLLMGIGILNSVDIIFDAITGGRGIIG